MAYTYRGKHTIAAEEAEAARQAANESPATTKGQPRQRRTTAVCGTNSGYQKHIRERTIACNPCLKAHAAAMAKARGTKSNWKPRHPVRCGTYAGATTHRKKGEKACFKCRLAENEYQREYRRRQRLAQQEKAA